MAKKCTVPNVETIAKGDAVCVVGFDTANNRPTVKRATRDNLATSKTVFGVAKDNAVFEDDAAGGSAVVFVAGEVAKNAVTSLGAGNSRIIATDINNATAANQCRLIRIDRPDGSEFVVGTCDEDGDLVVQPRASKDTSNVHVFNVRSYGALSDGATDDSVAITNAMSAIATGGGRLFFPSGTYSVASNLTIPSHVHVTFEEGAMLAPSGAAVTIQGPVTCHPAQRVFGGTGSNGPVTASDPGIPLPTVTVSGSAFGNYSFVVQIKTGGALGTATFKYSLDGTLFSYPALTAASVPIPTTGLVIGFGPGTYKKDSTYSWTSRAPITLGPAAFDRFSVRNFGAVPDWTPSNPVLTDNFPFFHAALGAMAASGNRSAKLVVDGHFYLSDTLVLTQTIVLEGTAMNEPPPFFTSTRSTPGTMLVFPKNVTGIRIRSAAGLDNPTKTLVHLFPPSGEKTVLRNLLVYCKDIDARAEAKECLDEKMDCIHEGDCIHGIHSSTVVRLENVTVEYFAHDGIHIVGAECGKPMFDEDGNPVLDANGNQVSVYDGNADGSYVENCNVGLCGRDGFHFKGGDAQTCVISRCSGVVNGRAGFYDATFGNTYLGCHSEGNVGPNYITKGDVNASVFINCWSESGSPPSQFKGAVTILSGKIGGDLQYMTPDSSPFILEHGVASRAPLVYKNLGVLKDGKRATAISCSLGSLGQTIQPPGLDMVAFEWATLKSAEDNNDDVMSLRYLDAPNVPPEARGHGWWALAHNNSFYRHMIRFPTMRAFARLPAPWFVNGIYLGRDDIGPPKVSFTAAPTLPNTQDNQDPLTYKKGDVVWNSEPSPGGPIGQVCIVSGTQSLSLGYQTDGPVNFGDTTVTVNKVNGLMPGQYIRIGDGADVYKIVKVTEPPPPANPTIDITPGALVGVPVGAAIVFTLPTIAPVNVGDTQVRLDNVEGLVLGQYIKIGDGPDTYKIVKVTLGTMDITPGAVPVDGIGAGAAIEIAALPTGVQTAKPVSKGDTTVMLTGADGLMPGQNVTIGGGADVYTIVTVTLPTIDIEAINPPPGALPGALAPVSIGKAIAFSPATFSTFGEVVNIGKSMSYAVNKQLELTDRYVTVTATGTIMTLSKSPVDGQTHSIKSQAGVTTTVDTVGGVLNIDGQNSVTLAPGDNGTFRYSAATGEWEIR